MKTIEKFKVLFDVPTGSQEFGVKEENSDHDFVILEKYKYLVAEFNRFYNLEFIKLGGSKLKKSKKRSVYVKIGDCMLNFIFVKDNKELEAWRRTTAILKTFPIDEIREKGIRVSIFDCIYGNIINHLDSYGFVDDIEKFLFNEEYSTLSTTNVKDIIPDISAYEYDVDCEW